MGDLQYEDLQHKETPSKLRVHITDMEAHFKYVTRAIAFAKVHFLKDDNGEPIKDFTRWTWYRVVVAAFAYARELKGASKIVRLPVHQQLRIPLPRAGSEIPMTGGGLTCLEALAYLCNIKTSGLTEDDLVQYDKRGVEVGMDAIWMAKETFLLFGLGPANLMDDAFFHGVQVPWRGNHWYSGYNAWDVFQQEVEEPNLKLLKGDRLTQVRDKTWFIRFNKRIQTVGDNGHTKQPFALLFTRANRNSKTEYHTPLDLSAEFVAVATFLLHRRLDQLEARDAHEHEGDQPDSPRVVSVLRQFAERVATKSLFEPFKARPENGGYASTSYEHLNPLEHSGVLIGLTVALKEPGPRGVMLKQPVPNPHHSLQSGSYADAIVTLCGMKTQGFTAADLADYDWKGVDPAFDVIWIARETFMALGFGPPNSSAFFQDLFARAQQYSHPDYRCPLDLSAEFVAVATFVLHHHVKQLESANEAMHPPVVHPALRMLIDKIATDDLFKAFTPRVGGGGFHNQAFDLRTAIRKGLLLIVLPLAIKELNLTRIVDFYLGHGVCNWHYDCRARLGEHKAATKKLNDSYPAVAENQRLAEEAERSFKRRVRGPAVEANSFAHVATMSLRQERLYSKTSRQLQQEWYL
ncbi:hypothetical protein ACM66B_003187 [Microbotryomycetes sp. NB124-2]